MKTTEQELLRTPKGTTPVRSESIASGSSSGPIKEFADWLLWNGISPAAKLPVSRIGIYTDFT